MREDVLLDIEGQVKRLNVLIEDILDVGRLESSHLTMEIQTLDLGLIISVVVASMQRMRPQHNFVMELPDDPVIITADRSRIEQVLYNLVDNAVKYSPKGGDIVIKVTQTASVIGVRVSDQGIGIPSEALDAIFERFYRVESAATQHIDGEGLGLATAKSIIESHGGTIWAESELGGGSTFVFTLPLPETHQPDTR
jgi:signal transduction histidine kinase